MRTADLVHAKSSIQRNIRASDVEVVQRVGRISISKVRHTQTPDTTATSGVGRRHLFGDIAKARANVSETFRKNVGPVDDVTSTVANEVNQRHSLARGSSQRSTSTSLNGALGVALHPVEKSLSSSISCFYPSPAIGRSGFTLADDYSSFIVCLPLRPSVISFLCCVSLLPSCDE